MNKCTGIGNMNLEDSCLSPTCDKSMDVNTYTKNRCEKINMKREGKSVSKKENECSVLHLHCTTKNYSDAVQLQITGLFLQIYILLL